MKVVSVKIRPLLALILILFGIILAVYVFRYQVKHLFFRGLKQHDDTTVSNNKDLLKEPIPIEANLEVPIEHHTEKKENEDDTLKDTWKHQEDLLKDVENVLKKDPSDVKAEIKLEKKKHGKKKEEEKKEEMKKIEEKVLEKVIEETEAVGGQGGVPSDPDIREKQQFVKNMMLHAWNGYKSYGWGANEVRPISKKGHSAGIFGSGNSGATIIDAIDTLYIMNLMQQYEDARTWIALNFNFEPRGDVSVFETNIRFIGGLLSIYALTGDRMFRLKAEDVTRKLLPAFDTKTGIPKSLINIKTLSTKNYPWASSGSSILSEFGTLQLEFDYLSHVSGDDVFAAKVSKINSHIRSIRLPTNLYSNFLNPTTGKWGAVHYSVGALGDSFYEYLLKGWLLHSKTDEEQRHTYDSAAVAIKEKLVQKKEGLTYVAEMKGSRLMHKMDHLACFSGGMFALGGFYGVHKATNIDETDDQVNKGFIQLGADITNTCHESYAKTVTKIGPDSFHFENNALATATRANEKAYLLRPEVIESYFVLWRTTKDPKYREWAWEAAQAIETHCRKEAGYSGLRDVTNAHSAHDDVQQSFFLAETLKYLYLIFSEDSLLPLDHWVFNTEAHPIPILTPQ